MNKKTLFIVAADAVALSFWALKKMSSVIPRAGRRHTLRVLVYHAVLAEDFSKDPCEDNVSAPDFERHILTIKKIYGERVISLSKGIEGLRSGDLAGDSICVTFDDGLEKTFANASGILKANAVNAAFFIIAGYLDGALRDDTHMSAGRIREIAGQGFEIGCHAYSHKSLAKMSGQELAREVNGAKEVFEKNGFKVKYFAYPYGFFSDFSEKTGELIKKSGFEAAFTNVMGDNNPGDNLYTLKRVRVSWRDNSFRFKLKLAGCYDWLDKLKAILHARTRS